MIKSIVVAVLILADGSAFTMRMESQDACEDFTRAIANYVASANCYRQTLEYYPPAD